MKAVFISEMQEVVEAAHYCPSVSIILPFEPKMSLKQEITHSLNIIEDQVKQELLDNYPGEIGLLVFQKLRAIIKTLNFNTHKKSIAIYVSPVFEKVLYLDIAVEEKVIVDDSFEIRDLLYNKKQLHKYLVLLLSGKESRMFLGNCSTFVRIVSNTPESVSSYINDMPSRVANFSDMSERKEIVMEKFLHHVDAALDIILNSYRLPLFVLGTEKMLGQFKKLTKHTGSVIDYIQGNYEAATQQELLGVLSPYIADWKRVKLKDLLNQLEEAAGKGKLALGMKKVWREAMNHKGRLLVVEKDYMYPAHPHDKAEIDKVIAPYNKFSYIRDAVDDVIEKVLENGGDVEFVDKDLMKGHRIALV